MAYVTGKSGSFTFTDGYLTWQVNWSETYDIASNSSIVQIDSIKVKSTAMTGTWHPCGIVKINGETVATMNYYSPSTHKVTISVANTYYAISAQNSGEALPWKSSAITHNTDGNKSITISIVANPAGHNLSSIQLYRESDGTIRTFGASQSATVDLTDIPRYATITAAPNFNDEENPTITYSNPAGNSATSLQACITLDGTEDDVAYRDVSKTGNSYTFNLSATERDVLRAATTGGNSRSVGFYLRTEISGNSGASKVWRTLTIKNPNPTIDPTITDANSATVALTGDSGVLVRYFSNAQVSIGAQAVKKASLTSRKVTCGTKALSADGIIEAVESGTFVFTATDNRGNTTQKVVEADFVEYVKLSCILGNNKPNAEGTMTLEVNGSCFNGSFGAASNTLSVYYRYKVSGGNYGNWKAMNVAVGDESYTATANLTGLDYQTAYVFQAYAVDKLATVYSTEKVVKAAPVFDWGENDFKFNVPVFDQFGSKFVSEANISNFIPESDLSDVVKMSALLDLVFPINSIYISYSHTSPAELFGGTWTRVIHNTGAGTFLYGSTAAAVIGECGGEAAHTLTVDEMPSHKHNLAWNDANPQIVSLSGNKAGASTATASQQGYRTSYSVSTVYKDSYIALPTGGGAAHNNIPPYIKVSIWRRTA